MGEYYLMNYFQYDLEFEDLKNIVDNLQIRIKENKMKYKSTKQIATYVFKECSHLIPSHLHRLLRKSNALEYSYSSFKKDLVEHLVTNSKLINAEKHDHLIKLSDYLDSTIEWINTDLKEGIDETERRPDNVLRNSKKILDFLSIETKDKKRVPSLYTPLITTATLMYKRHVLLYDKSIPVLKNSKVDETKLEQINTYIYVFNESLKKKEVNSALICNYIFERQYNINLMRTIASIPSGNFIDHENAYKVLCLTYFLPNIQGRIKLIKMLANCVEEIPIYSFERNDVENNLGILIPDYSRGASSRRMNEALWFSRVPEIILKLAFVTIPVMEALHYYLCTYDNSSFKFCNTDLHYTKFNELEEFKPYEDFDSYNKVKSILKTLRKESPSINSQMKNSNKESQVESPSKKLIQSVSSISFLQKTDSVPYFFDIDYLAHPTTKRLLEILKVPI